MERTERLIKIVGMLAIGIVAISAFLYTPKWKAIEGRSTFIHVGECGYTMTYEERVDWKANIFNDDYEVKNCNVHKDGANGREWIKAMRACNRVTLWERIVFNSGGEYLYAPPLSTGLPSDHENWKPRVVYYSTNHEQKGGQAVAPHVQISDDGKALTYRQACGCNNNDRVIPIAVQVFRCE